MREWWREGVPLAAVLAGLGEVFARRAEQQGGPVSSLSYCRHAVARHARRLAANRVGSPEAELGSDTRQRLDELGDAVGTAAERWSDFPGLVSALTDLATAIRTLPVAAAPADLDRTLASLEEAAVAGMAELLPSEARRTMEEGLRDQLAGLVLEGEVGRRTVRALRLRGLRELIGLPRLELA